MTVVKETRHEQFQDTARLKKFFDPEPRCDAVILHPIKVNVITSAPGENTIHQKFKIIRPCIKIIGAYILLSLLLLALTTRVQETFILSESFEALVRRFRAHVALLSTDIVCFFQMRCGCLEHVMSV